MNQYRYFDTDRADGVYITWKRVHVDDPDAHPHQMGPMAPQRVEDWRRNKWHYVGIMAKVTIEVVRMGSGVAYELYSAGCWGVESDSDEAHFVACYVEERQALEADLNLIVKALE